MKNLKKPTYEELKGMKVCVKFLVSDMPPKDGLKRLQYYTYFPQYPGKHYFGLSFRKEEDPSRINKMVENGTVIILSPPIQLPYEKDLFLNFKGQVILANGASPWKDENQRIVATPRKLSKAFRLLDNQLNKYKLPKVSSSHIISSS